MRAFVLCLLFAFTLAQNCKSTGCTKGNCCSYWGYCGNTNAHCGSGSMQCVCDCNGRNPCKSSGTTTPTPTTPTTSSEKTIWDFLYKKIGNKYGVAGLMGNLYAESGLISNNVQNSYEYRVGSDSSYTSKVDNGSYSRYSFAHDSAGYGLAQWTYWSRKQNLYDYAKKVKKSIGDATMQLEFLVSELQGSYSSVWNTLKSATSVLQASNSVLLKFERPADQSSSVQSKRASYGQSYYNKYAGSSSSNPNPPPSTSCTKYASTDYLNIRKGPGTNYGKVKTINPGTIVCVVSTSNGWSKLSDGYYASATYLTKYTEPKPGSYKPRLTIPEYGNKYYNLVSDGGYSTGIAGKPKQAGLGVLSNCVGYASGRFNEIVGAGKFKYFNYPPNAVKFIEAAKSQGLTVSNTPSLGAIIVWGLRQNGVEQAGHVGVVEKINADGSIVTSESAWNGWAFKTKTRYNRSGNWDGGSYYFRGFIKNPAVK
jgi:CHAP domain./Bacterial SH3 domain.